MEKALFVNGKKVYSLASTLELLFLIVSFIRDIIDSVIVIKILFIFNVNIHFFIIQFFSLTRRCFAPFFELRHTG